MDVVGALVGVHGLEVDHVPHDAVLVMDAIATVHVARGAGNGKGLPTVVALDEADHLGSGLVVVQQAADAQAGLQPEGDFGLHVDEFHLH